MVIKEVIKFVKESETKGIEEGFAKYLGDLVYRGEKFEYLNENDFIDVMNILKKGTFRGNSLLEMFYNRIEDKESFNLKRIASNIDISNCDSEFFILRKLQFPDLLDIVAKNDNYVVVMNFMNKMFMEHSYNENEVVRKASEKNLYSTFLDYVKLREEKYGDYHVIEKTIMAMGENINPAILEKMLNDGVYYSYCDEKANPRSYSQSLMEVLACSQTDPAIVNILLEDRKQNEFCAVTQFCNKYGNIQTNVFQMDTIVGNFNDALQILDFDKTEVFPNNDSTYFMIKSNPNTNMFDVNCNDFGYFLNTLISNCKSRTMDEKRDFLKKVLAKANIRMFNVNYTKYLKELLGDDYDEEMAKIDEKIQSGEVIPYCQQSGFGLDGGEWGIRVLSYDEYVEMKNRVKNNQKKIGSKKN